jgi:isocitrate dehydrogenase kinase/phosphatase
LIESVIRGVQNSDEKSIATPFFSSIFCCLFEYDENAEQQVSLHGSSPSYENNRNNHPNDLCFQSQIEEE